MFALHKLSLISSEIIFEREAENKGNMQKARRLVLILIYSIIWGGFIAAQNATANVALPDAPKREMRAVWLTTYESLDWPKSKANTQEGIAAQKRELCDILDRLKAININTVLLQTRVRGTTIYPSEIEPWDACITGRYGKAPAYDPLAFAIEECHRRGMELHPGRLGMVSALHRAQGATPRQNHGV